LPFAAGLIGSASWHRLRGNIMRRLCRSATLTLTVLLLAPIGAAEPPP
jgi:hypothetical protein